eukprot:TRINITY_DN525_c0_g1_i1.p1 TRINITY_DN525_c0_g1~~TRINITY_DN525_c0_g1_i1.p1  ORF type:complete len:116 (-),score=10.79 TRINITY_DN525_c0_g1_i1:513-860(-)
MNGFYISKHWDFSFLHFWFIPQHTRTISDNIKYILSCNHNSFHSIFCIFNSLLDTITNAANLKLDPFFSISKQLVFNFMIHKESQWLSDRLKHRCEYYAQVKKSCWIHDYISTDI